MPDAPRRRTEAEARRCSQEDCPGDGRYQPPGKGHLPDCQHNAVTWVWGTVEADATISERVAVAALIETGRHNGASARAALARAVERLADYDTRVTPPDEDVPWCGGSHLGACHVPDATGICELSTRVLPPGVGRDPVAAFVAAERALHAGGCLYPEDDCTCDTSPEEGSNRG